MHHEAGFLTERQKTVPTDRSRGKSVRGNANIGIRGLLTIFKPAIPERVLPRDPHPNYVPLYLEKNCSMKRNGFSTPDSGTGCDSETYPSKHQRCHDNYHFSRTHRQSSSSAIGTPDSESNEAITGEGCISNVFATGAKCPHCDSVLAYAYNLTKHIEVCFLASHISLIVL